MDQITKDVLNEQKEDIQSLDKRVEILEGFIWTLIDYIGAYGNVEPELQGRLEHTWKEAQKGI